MNILTIIGESLTKDRKVCNNWTGSSFCDGTIELVYPDTGGVEAWCSKCNEAHLAYVPKDVPWSRDVDKNQS